MQWGLYGFERVSDQILMIIYSNVGMLQVSSPPVHHVLENVTKGILILLQSYFKKCEHLVLSFTCFGLVLYVPI